MFAVLNVFVLMWGTLYFRFISIMSMSLFFEIVATETQYSGDTIVLIFPDGTGPAVLSAMIAGIPLNRCHELQFQPGELRINVTMDRTLALWEEKKRLIQLQQQQQQQQQREQQQSSSSPSASSQDYSTILQQGEKELQLLRSMDMDTVLSRKDQMIEEERLIIEQQYQQQEEKRRLQKEQEERERKKRLQALEERRKILQQSQHPAGSDNLLVPLSVAGFFGVAGVAAFTAARNKAETSGSLESTTLNSDFPNRAVALSESSNDFSDESFSEGSIRLVEEDATALTYDGQIPNTQKQREQAAEEAMQDYLDQDDGGKAWLKVMEELVKQDDANDKDLFDSQDELSSINGSEGDFFPQNKSSSRDSKGKTQG